MGPMSTTSPTFPELSHHVAIAGTTGSGKTWRELDMLSRRLAPTRATGGKPFAWIVIDPKWDSTLGKMPFEKLSPRAKFLPDSGVHIIRPNRMGKDKADTEDLLMRAFKKKKIGVLMDEGHIYGPSPAIRQFLIGGRSQLSPVMYGSQRASDIDPFIWSQATYFCCGALRGPNDHRRFHENYGFKYQDPAKFHSWYFDGEQNDTYLLEPASPIDESIDRFNAQLLKRWNHI